MIAAGLILAALAAALHVFIFVLESYGWTGERARATFGTTPEEATATRELAFNQGFYNLFLAIAVFLGLALWSVNPTIGATLIFTGIGSMLAAALVLLLSAPLKRAAALTQGTLPFLGILALGLGLTL